MFGRFISRRGRKATKSSLSLGTGDKPQFLGIEMGHATDTTIEKSGSGDIQIEGNKVYRVGGTDVAIADGGTGAGTAQTAINALTAVSGATNEHVLTKDTSTGNAVFKAAAGGGGTSRWNTTLGGYKTGINNTNTWYTQGYGNYYAWSNQDTDPTTAWYSNSQLAPAITMAAGGTLTFISALVRPQSTADDLKFYVYRASNSDGDKNTGSKSCTLIGTSDAIMQDGSPSGNAAYYRSTTISSSNTFSADDSLYVWFKSEEANGTTNYTFSVTIGGEYS